MNFFLRQKVNAYIGAAFIASSAFAACWVIIRAAGNPDPLGPYTQHLAEIELELTQ